MCLSFWVKVALSVLLVTLSAEAWAHTVVDLAGLLSEMTDLERLTETSSPGYTTRQCSSYDRRSTDPSVATEDNWFANYDRNQHLRVEERDGQTEYVLMDAAGPGAVVRFWSANPQEGGVLRVYLDYAEEPVVEMPLHAMLGGKTKPFIAPFSGERGKGWNSYLPIPYNKHCKITVSEGDIYYLITYRSYDPEVAVCSFSMAAAETHMPLIRAQAARLANPAAIEPPDMNIQDYRIHLNPGATETMVCSGEAAIKRIRCKLEASDMEAALRGCVLEIAFDGNRPAISAPLGDFFGTAPGANPYQSLPSGVGGDGFMYCHWVMPFREEAILTLNNRTGADVALHGDVATEARSWTQDSLYFHAKWRTAQDIPTRPFQDWNYLTAEGQGRFVGVMLHIANPVVQWWGEGDEKIYVDGEPFPGHFGTGTEDYFGYAWCDTELFTHAYHNQIRCDGPGNFGHTCVSRFHIMDDIPFSRSFRFDMEVWHWADTHITQAITAYWYAAPGASDNFVAPPRDMLTVSELTAPPGVPGALEGEQLHVIAVTGGQVEEQSSPVWPWSRAMQLWWREGQPGDALVLGVPVESADVYEVFARFTKAPDYGIHRITVNDTVAADSVDLYHTEVIAVEEVSLGKYSLDAGENRLRIEIISRNPDNADAYMFGLDYLRLERQ